MKYSDAGYPLEDHTGCVRDRVYTKRNEHQRQYIKAGADAAKLLADAINGGNIHDVAKGFYAALTSEHRLLQGHVVRVMLQVLKTYGNKSLHDGRNEMEVALCMSLLGNADRVAELKMDEEVNR